MAVSKNNIRELIPIFRGTNFIDNQKRGMYEKKIS